MCSVLLASAHPHDRAERLLVMRIVIKSITEVMQERKNHFQNTPKSSWACVAVFQLILPEPLDHNGWGWSHQASWTQMSSVINEVFPNWCCWNWKCGPRNRLCKSLRWMEAFPNKTEHHRWLFVPPLQQWGQAKSWAHAQSSAQAVTGISECQGLNLFLRMQCWFQLWRWVMRSQRQSRNTSVTLLIWRGNIFSTSVFHTHPHFFLPAPPLP